jgi:putative transposase
VDNGKDYKSTLLNGERHSIYKASPSEREWGLIQELGIAMRHCKRYHAQSKHIERFFRTLEMGWMNLLPGWCGNNTQNRPEKLKTEIAKTQEWLDSEGQRGEKLLLTWWEFEEEIDSIIAQYNNKPHAGLDGLTPMQAYQANRLTTVKIPRPETYDLVMLPSLTRKIQTDGIHLSIKGISRRYNNKALWDMVGQTVEVRYNPHKPESIIILKNARYISHANADEEYKPFADTEEERNQLAEYIEGREHLRKEYKEKRKQIAQCDPRLYPRVDTPLAVMQGTEEIPLISRYDKAGEQIKKTKIKKEKVDGAQVAGALALFKYQTKKK